MRRPVPFGKYLLLDRISVGGMAEVFRAKSFGVEGFEKIIAVKRILPSMGQDRDFIDMFVDEAKIVGQLSHANICQVFELGKIGAAHFIAMEFVWGKDLLQIQNRFCKIGEIMPLPMACFIVAKVCEGLDYAHRKRDPLGQPLHIVHRDCSPQNILISYEGEVKIIDFGIAKAASRSAKTVAGVLKGKFGYMSPEQVRGLALDRRSDIFAVGTMLYESVTGQRLFQSESDFTTLEKVRNVDILPPSHFNRNIPEELERIVLRSLARSPDERYQWASEMQADLQAVLMAESKRYTAKQLGDWLKDVFTRERMREQRTLERFAVLGPDGKRRNIPDLLVSDRQETAKLIGERRDSSGEFDDGPTEIFGELNLEEDSAVQEVLVAGGDGHPDAMAPLGARRRRPGRSTGRPLPPSQTPAPPGRGRGGAHRPADPSLIHGDGPRSPPGGVPVLLPHARTAPVAAIDDQQGVGARSRAILRDVVLGLALAAALLVMVAAGKYLLIDSRLRGRDTVVKTPGTIAVTVPDLEPADVLLNGDRIGAVESGQAFTIGKLRPGSYQITVRRVGVPDCVRAVDLAPGRVEVVSCTMSRPRQSGELVLEALPEDATVFVDGQEISAAAAREPLVLRAGRSHEVEIHRGDVVVAVLEVQLSPGERLRRRLDIQRLRVRPAGRSHEGKYRRRRAHEQDNDGDNGSRTGAAEADSSPASAAAGDKRRRAADAGPTSGTNEGASQPPANKPENKPANKDNAPDGSEAPTKDKTGHLVAWTSPWARVFIDGKDTGMMTPIAPTARIALVPGKHRVTFVVGDQRFSYAVTIESGQTLRLRKELPVAKD